jgi:cytochrome bd-type quinol oxidase subunit 2
MTKNYKKYLQATIIFIFAFIVLAMPVLSMAQQPVGTANGGEKVGTANSTITIGNPFKGLPANGNLSDLLYAVLDNAVIPIGGIIVVIMIIYSGFLFVTARGNEEQIKTARRSFTYAAIGAAILLGAKAIALAIQATINGLK